MQIKKISDQVSYSKVVRDLKFEINGKLVNVEVYDSQDNISNIFDSGEDINERDLEKLTDEEHETFGENLKDLIELKENEITNIN